jgi:hypothetical protein
MRLLLLRIVALLYLKPKILGPRWDLSWSKLPSWMGAAHRLNVLFIGARKCISMVRTNASMQ